MLIMLERPTYNYFDNTTKLFPDLYLVKFLDTSAKWFPQVQTLNYVNK